MEWWTKPSISRLQLVTIAVGCMLFLLTETTFFDELPDIIKFGIYLSLMILCASLGVSFVDLKKIGEKVKKVFVEKDFLTLEKEVQEWTKIGMEVMQRLGRTWELFDKEQMKRKAKEKKKK